MVLHFNRRRLTTATSVRMSSDLTNIQAAASQPPRDADPNSAPWYNVPQRAIVNVEHICIIQNVERAIDTLGGTAKVQQVWPFILIKPSTEQTRVNPIPVIGRRRHASCCPAISAPRRPDVQSHTLQKCRHKQHTRPGHGPEEDRP